MDTPPPDSPLDLDDLDQDPINQVQMLLNHFETLEAQFAQVREGLTHSHRLSTLGTIASIIAHEYNNILTPVISYAQMAQAKPDNLELAQKAVDKALIGAQRAAKISSSLLGFARESDAELVADLPKVVDDAIACLGREPHKDGVDLELDLPNLKVAISPLNLQQVILNLCLNAMKAMRNQKRGNLRIQAKQQAQLVTLEISDTGPGIPEEIHNRLFEPFVTQKHNEADAGETRGTGLGLCICRDLIKEAGGSITFSTQPNHGTTFYLQLPIADDLFSGHD